MTLFHIIFLALVQGLTEFLPISSSAHLILPSALLNFPDQGLAFDVAVHVGTLLAVVWYFRKDIRNLIVAWLAWVFSGSRSNEGRLAWLIILATIPAGLAGLAFEGLIEHYLRSILVIAMTTIVFGVLLGVADRYSSLSKPLESLNWKSALLIGLAQALALIPGTSRSGVTLTAGLALGLDRVSAARFSFLLSIPIIVLSGAFEGVGLLGMESVPWGSIALGVGVSAITAYLCIRVFLALINRIGMMPFVWYRLALGGVLLWLVFTGKVA